MQKYLLFLLPILFFSCQNTADRPSGEEMEVDTETPFYSIEDLSKTEEKIEEETEQVEDFTYQPAPASTPRIEPDELRNNLYAQLSKAVQTFHLGSDESGVIQCKEGTVIHFQKKAFEFSDGTAVVGDVQIEVIEYYSKSDLLRNNLPTQSNGQLLESGGTIKVEAFANGKKCQLKKGKYINVEFPAESKKEGMQTFIGEIKNAEVNWVPQTMMAYSKDFQKDTLIPATDLWLDQSVSMRADTTISISRSRIGKAMIREVPYFEMLVEGLSDKRDHKLTRMAYFPKNMKDIKKFSGAQSAHVRISPYNRKRNRTLVNYLTRDLVKNYDKQPRDSIARVKVEYTLCDKGCMQAVRIKEGYNSQLDQLILESFEKMPLWRPAKYMTEAVEVTDSVLITFGMPRTEIYFDSIDQIIIDQPYNYSGFNSYLSSMNSYLLRSENLGYINCDRFYNVEGPKMDMIVRVPGAEDADVKLVFSDIQAVMNGYKRSKNSYIFMNIPRGMEVRVMAVKYEEGSYSYAVEEAEVGKPIRPLTDFRAINIKELDSEFKKFDQG